MDLLCNRATADNDIRTVMGGKSHGNTYRAGWMDWTLFDVIDEWNMIRRVPIQTVEHRIELHRVD